MKQNLVFGLGALFFLVTIEVVTLYSKNIIVTGGAGFIGSHVCEVLLQRGDRVIVIDNLNDYYGQYLKRANLARLQESRNASMLSVHETDICDLGELDKIISNFLSDEKQSIDAICHLAAHPGVRPSVENPELYMCTNIIGTLHLFELAKKYHIPHFVLASSSSVYGNCADVPFSEESKVDFPCSPYAMTKRASELLAYTYHYLHAISCTCLRFFTVYGPSGRPDMAPFKFMDSIFHGHAIQQYGDGSSMRDFTYVSDIADGIVRSIDRPLGYEIINLGRGEPVYLYEFIKILQEVIRKKAHIVAVQKPKSDVDITHADISKARRLLGYNPQVSLREGLQKMYAWYLNTYLKLVVIE